MESDMLILGRKFEETVRILTPEGRLIVLKVIPARYADQCDVRLGFEADREVLIERGELTLRDGGSRIDKLREGSSK